MKPKPERDEYSLQNTERWEREGNVLVSVGLKLFLMSLPAAVCGAAFARVSLLRASHASECTSLTLSFSIPHTHTHTRGHSFPPPSLTVGELSLPPFVSIILSSLTSSPLLSQTPPAPALFLSLMFVLISLSLCEISWYSWWQMSFLWLLHLFCQKLRLLTQKLQPVSTPRVCVCVCVCVCGIYQSHTTLATGSPAVFFVSTCNIFYRISNIMNFAFQKIYAS